MNPSLVEDNVKNFMNKSLIIVMSEKWKYLAGL